MFVVSLQYWINTHIRIHNTGERVQERLTNIFFGGDWMDVSCVLLAFTDRSNFSWTWNLWFVLVLNALSLCLLAFIQRLHLRDISIIKIKWNLYCNCRTELVTKLIKFWNMSGNCSLKWYLPFVYLLSQGRLRWPHLNEVVELY